MSLIGAHKAPTPHFDYLPIDGRYYLSHEEHRVVKLIQFSRMFNKWQQYVNMPNSARMNLIERLERSCHNTAIRKAKKLRIRASWSDSVFIRIYITVCVKILTHLNLDFSNKLVLNVLDGKYDIDTIAEKSSKELCPEKYVDELQKIEKMRNQKIEREFNKFYKCGRCHEYKCGYVNHGGRSADEGMGLKIVCANCGWHMIIS